MRGERRQTNSNTENGKVAEGEKAMRTAAPRLCSQGTPVSMRVVIRDVRKRDSSPSSKQMRSDTKEIAAFVDSQMESVGGIKNGEVAEGEDGVGTAAQRRGSKENAGKHGCGMKI